MKQLVCELCGSNDLLKDNGLFVCQYCGTKYTLEEAKKLFVEGKVQIDHSKEIADLITLARRSKENKDIENAKKYYSAVLEKDPSNWEASFYDIYYRCYVCTNKEIVKCAISLQNCQGSVVELIENSDSIDKTEAIHEVTEKLVFISSQYVRSAREAFNTLAKRYPEPTYDHTDIKDKLIKRIDSSTDILIHFGDILLTKSNNREYRMIAIGLWEKAIDLIQKNTDLASIQSALVKKNAYIKNKIENLKYLI